MTKKKSESFKSSALQAGWELLKGGDGRWIGVVCICTASSFPQRTLTGHKVKSWN